MVLVVQKSDLNLLALLLVFAVLNAFLVNIIGLSIPLFNLVVIAMILWFSLAIRQVKFTMRHLIYVFSACILLLMLLSYAMFFPIEVVKEPFYHLSVITIMSLMVLIYQKNNLHSSVSSKFFAISIAIYAVISVVIHQFYWEEVAAIFSKHDYYFDLKMDGDVNRMYGLLFNPLNQAFFFLYLFFYLYLKGYSNKLIYAITLLVVALSFVRTAIIIMLIFLSYLLTKKIGKIPSLLLYSLMIFLGFAYFWQDVTSLDLDQTGSINEHFMNIVIGYDAATHIVGYGFISPEILGSWNVRLEGWVSQYSFTYGILGLLMIFVIHVPSVIMSLKRNDVDALVILFLMILSINIFPIHTFQLALTMYMILLSYIAFYRSTYQISSGMYRCNGLVGNQVGR